MSEEDIRPALDARKKTFMGLELDVTPGVLVPREETELLAREAIERLRTIDRPRVIDMCCGAGNIACAIAHHVPPVRVWASDLTDQCVALARCNVEKLHLSPRILVMQGDLFEPLRSFGLEGAIDMVVCNPPYISTGRLDKERAELLESEPREAFDAGPYGLAIHGRLFADAPAFLKPGGLVLCEFGLGQERQVKALAARTRRFSEVEFVNDAEGRPRVACASRLP